MKKLINTVFDYSVLSKEEAGKLRCLATELSKIRKRATAEMLECGKTLYDAQQILADYDCGVFGAWLEANGISSSTAYRWIDAHLQFGGFPNWENLEMSAMYVLAKDEPARKEALKLAKNGIRVTNAMAKELLQNSGKTSPPKTQSGGKSSENGKPGGDFSSSSEITQDSDGPASSYPAADPHSPADGEEYEEYENMAAAQDEPPEDENRPDPTEQAKKNKALCLSLRDKLARAIADYHAFCPNRAECDRQVKVVQGVKLW